VDSWLSQGNRGRPPAPGTVLAYTTSVKIVAGLLEAAGAGSVEAVTRGVAGRMVNEMSERGDHPVTIARHVAAMSSCWRWLQRRGIARDDVRNVWHDQGLPERGPSQKRVFTDGELLALLNGPATVECADVMRLLALSGVRVSELYDLRC